MNINQEQFARFAEAVKAGKVPGLKLEQTRPQDELQGTFYGFLMLEGQVVAKSFGEGWIIVIKCGPDILCAHIRRELTAAGWDVRLHLSEPASDSFLLIGNLDSQSFHEGSELDWHIAAWLTHLERETK